MLQTPVVPNREKNVFINKHSTSSTQSGTRASSLFAVVDSEKSKYVAVRGFLVVVSYKCTFRFEILRKFTSFMRGEYIKYLYNYDL